MSHQRVGLRVLIASTIGIIVAGTTFYRFVENFSWVDAYYFSVITLTTVGYGDISPQTDTGKIFTTFYILIGVGIITAFITNFAHYRMMRRAKK
jgi:voltage-gated potassium channel Kch